MWYYDRVYHYFEAANYLTVAQMFLKDNVLLKESLAKDHIKSIPGGHWGASPGINMIISCILNAIQMSGQDEKDYNLILGSGHANAALLANMYLNGFLEEYYPEYKYGYDGLKALCQAYSSPSGFSGEVSAKMPGCIYPGGELGYALATAYGTVIGNKDRVTFVILGDGECETSTTCAAWLAHKLIDNTEHGHVIPIVNLNQYKMGSRTIMSKMSNSELIQYYAGLGMKAQICEDWHCLADSMIEAVAKIDTDNTVLVYRTVKGWTGPSDPSLSEEDNALNAHKVPIKRPIQNDADFEALKKWLLSYVPSRIFNSTNSPNDEIMQMRYKELFSFITDRETPMQVPSCTKSGNTTSDSLSDILMTSILKGKQIYIFSPDELISNGFGKMLDNGTVQKFVIETLNEGICQAMYEGLTLSNGHGVLISYE